MRIRLPIVAFCTSLLALSHTTSAPSQGLTDELGALAEASEMPITVDNFVRAATDLEFAKYVSLGGGVNQFFHFRAPTQIDNQPTIRMNRDTLYSAAIVDISQGATLTMPEVGERYMSAMIVNQDHHINEVFHGGGTYTLDIDTFDTPYVSIFVRTLVDAADAADVAKVNAIQNQMTINAASSKAFVPPNYDEDGFEAMVSAILALGPFVPNSFRMFGAKGEVDGVRHLIGTAGGWGGLPEREAFYLNVDPGLSPTKYAIEVPADVPVAAFWSVSLYNARGFFELNDRDAYSVYSVTGTRNADGSTTIHLGGCDDDRVNCLPIMAGWNYTVRMYRPGQEVLDGSWTFPAANPVQ